MKDYLVLFAFFLTTNGAYAQASVDSTFSDRHFYAANSQLALRENLLLYYGKQYLRNNRNVAGHPFFIMEKPIRGSVVYNEVQYDSIPLYYDINSDQLIADNYTNDNQIILVPEKVTAFSLAGHKFVRLSLTTPDAGTFDFGFAELAFAGQKVKLYIKHRKELPMAVGNNDDRQKFKESSSYYAEINKQIFAVNSERLLMKTLKDHDKEVQKFIDETNLSFKRNKEELLIKVISYYDSLIK